MRAPSDPLPSLCVSVVLYHSDLSHLRATLVSLRQSIAGALSQQLLGRAAIYLVDNTCEASYCAQLASLTDELAEQLDVSLHIVSQARNRGFGHGHNYAMEECSSDYHLVLNPDVELLPDTLAVGLLLLTAQQDVILVSPEAKGSEGDQEFLCKRYPSVLVLLLRGFAPQWLQRFFRRTLDRYEMHDECSAGNVVEVGIASGCYMLLRTQALQACAGFDECYFLYFEDFDLSLRLQKHGKLVFAPQMKITHHGGYAAQKGLQHVRYFVASGVRFFRQHGWRWI